MTSNLGNDSFLSENERKEMKVIHLKDPLHLQPLHTWFVLCPTMIRGMAAKHINLATRTGLLAELNRVSTGESKDSTSLLPLNSCSTERPESKCGAVD